MQYRVGSARLPSGQMPPARSLTANLAEPSYSQTLGGNGGRSSDNIFARQNENIGKSTNIFENRGEFQAPAHSSQKDSFRQLKRENQSQRPPHRFDKLLSLDIQHLHNLLQSNNEWINIQETIKQSISHLLNITIQQQNQLNQVNDSVEHVSQSVS